MSTKIEKCPICDDGWMDIKYVRKEFSFETIAPCPLCVSIGEIEVIQE